MRKFTFLIFCFALFCLQSSAQKRQKLTPEEIRMNAYQEHLDTTLSKFHNNIALCGRLQGGEIDSLAQLSDDVELSPYLFRLTSPDIYYSSSVRRAFALDDPDASSSDKVSTDGMDYRDRLQGAIDDMLCYRYLSSPSTFKYYDADLEREQLVESADIKQAKPDELKKILAKAENKVNVAEVVGPLDVNLKIERPNFWKTKGQFGLQFSQNYFSEKWYKGGNNNLNNLTSLLLEANYNDQQNIEWDNRLEMRLGFITTTSDTVHKFLSNDDRINLNTKLGVKAWQSFFYTVQGEAKTQFCPGYRSNDTTVYSRFLAPLDMLVSIGMDYKPKLSNGNSLSVVLFPLSYKLRYINGGDETIIKAYAMRDKKRSQSDFGSKLEFNCTFNLLKNLTWRSRLYYYTSYKYVEAEFENNLSFTFNKYISSEINALWRFDDNRDMKYWDDTLGFFQFKEFFTLGLKYAF